MDQPREAAPPALRARRTGVLLVLLAGLLWSLGGASLKLSAADPLVFGFWRSLFAGAVLLPLWRVAGGVAPSARWMALSIPLYTLVVCLLMFAMARATAASGILLQYTAPVWCALLSFALLGRRLKRRSVVALLIAAAGVAVMIGAGEPGRSVLPTIAGLVSGFAFGCTILVLEQVNRAGDNRVNPIAVATLNNLGAAAIAGPAAWALAGSLALTPAQALLIAVTGAVQLGLAYAVFQVGLRRVNPVDASLLILIEPILNPVWVWLAVGEAPDEATLAGGAAILVAVVIEVAGEVRRRA